MIASSPNNKPRAPRNDSLIRVASLFRAGFTLIEIVVVVCVLVILSILIMPQYTKMVERSRQSEAYSHLGFIRSGQLRYFVDNSIYAYNWANLDISQPVTGYFSYILPVSESWTATSVARATRQNKQNAGYGSYTMDVSPDGTIIKTADPSAVSPP